jgi:hypothetical protein
VIDAGGALFRRADQWFHPTLLTTGPWRPDAMHGGPPSALMGWAVDRAVEPNEHIARINIELERPVPLEPLRMERTRRQVSRRVAHVDVVLRTAARAVASARALLLRTEPVPALIFQPADDMPVVPGPERVVSPPSASHSAPILYHRDATEHRMIEGGFEIPGPGTSWVRLTRPLIEGEQTSGLCSLLAVADFGSAISQSVVAGAGVGLINVDVSVALSRYPVGPWICLRAAGMLNQDGAGLAVTHLTDSQGALGIATQSQIGHSY